MYFDINGSRNAICRYFRAPTKDVEFSDAIERVLAPDTLREIDNNTFNLNSAVKSMDCDEANVVISLVNTIRNQLRYSRKNNSTGYFGVIQNVKFGYRWSYLNLVENQFRYSEVIYASSLAELERKVKSKGHIWYVFDDTLAGNARKTDRNIRPYSSPKRTVKKQSKFKGMSAAEEIKKKRELKNTVLKKTNIISSDSMIEKMFI